MRRSLLVFLAVAVSTFLILGVSWAQCPEDAKDKGTCDTLYVEPYNYAAPGSYPTDLQVAIWYTHDVPDPTADSIAGFIIPLCYTSSNASANAAIPAAKNNTDLYPFPTIANSIFRHLPDNETETFSNFMMTYSETFMGYDWDTRILDLGGGTHFWLSAVITGSQDKGFGPGSRVLVATVTFTLDDTTTLCIDSCFWPPTARLQCSNADASVFIPRHNLPFCYISTEVREIPDAGDNRPSEFSLSQNYPNPFNPVTNVEFSVSRTAHVKLDIFNIVGQKVRTLVDEEMEAGKYVVDWDGKDENGHWVSSGIYFYRMQANDFSDMKKMLLVK
jgi:hypothetical protein